jgi:AcrR family transcriptional regulator
VPPEKTRTLRADAQLNQDRLLQSAARAFARDGPAASLKAIAKDAGVGIGTLYRRFPTRERLIEATYRNETARLCAAAPGLLSAQSAAQSAEQSAAQSSESAAQSSESAAQSTAQPATQAATQAAIQPAAQAATERATQPAALALRAWMDLFVDYMATKHGMAEALRAVLVTDGALRMRTRDLLTDALAMLMAAGVAERTVRADVDPNDVLMSLGGVTLIAGEESQRDLARRLLDLLMDGITYRNTDRSDGIATNQIKADELTTGKITTEEIK